MTIENEFKAELSSKLAKMSSTAALSAPAPTQTPLPGSSTLKHQHQIQQQMHNGLFIRKEIARFESVHPNIYSVYDLIEAITDFNLQQQIREHIVNIEDSFVNSQEWTLSRSVPDIKLGIVGAPNSGKSSLVHRFLTGTYMHEESPEGGRFKKEVVIDGQSYLLLIRDEGGAPEMQFTHWVDAVVFVFSLENEESFTLAHHYYAKMTHYRNMADVPFVLVGTQDYISEANPRLIDDTRARALATELKRCVYYETCATYGLHVERVFHDACQKVVNFRAQLLANLSAQMTKTNGAGLASVSTSSIRLLAGQLTNGSASGSPVSDAQFFHANANNIGAAAMHGSGSVVQQSSANAVFKEPMSVVASSSSSSSEKKSKFLDFASLSGRNGAADEHAVTPLSTPNQKRKDTNRRRSNLFTPNKKEDKNKLSDMGVGRSIPVKQGFLYKKTNSSLNKDWKKKFVTLNDDGSLKYYPSINDYMEDIHTKEIDLQKTTIKMPGTNKPRMAKVSISTNTDAAKLSLDINSLNLNGELKHFDDMPNGVLMPPGLAIENQLSYLARLDANSSKKRHRRVKSTHKSSGLDQNGKEIDDQEGFEFIIVSLDNKQWHFEAASQDERDEWVHAIEQQILSSLQSNETNKLKNKLGAMAADNMAIQTMKSVPGNTQCADCDAPNPVWASLNHGALICIECSGIHRNLGTHLSRVRSLELDDWSNELIQLMTSIGNKLLNSIYEANKAVAGKPKPISSASRDEKEKWIRGKYESKLYLAQLVANPKEVAIGKQLIEAVMKQDLAAVMLILGHAKPEDVNTCVNATNDRKTSLHLAASLSNSVILQLLIWYGADVDAVDSQGRNALAYARSANSQECIQLLLYNNCSDFGPVINEVPIVVRGNNTLTRRSQSSTSNSQLNGYDKLPYNMV